MKDDRVPDTLSAHAGPVLAYPGPGGPDGAGIRLAAVVVTYNRLPQLQITIGRLLKEPVDAVLVVDNASEDGTADWLATLDDPRLRVLRLPENTGGAGGFEAGLGTATRDLDPDWTVLMDDDARPKAGALAAFRAAAAGIDPNSRDRNALGGIAAAVVFPDGRICEMNRPSRNPFWHLPELIRTLTGRGHRGFHLRDAHLRAAAPPSQIDVASFVGFFVSRGAVARAGLPEGGLFIYGDDVIYSLNLRRAGVGLELHPAVRFEHDCASLGVGLVTRPMWKVYYLSRNGVALARLAAGWWLFPVALGWYILAWSRKVRYYADCERPLYRALMWQGVRDGLIGRRGRNAAVHDRVAREERKAAMLQGRRETERPASMRSPVSASDDLAGQKPAAQPIGRASLAANPPALKTVSAPSRQPPLAAPKLAVPKLEGSGAPAIGRPADISPQKAPGPGTSAPPRAKPAHPGTRPLAQPARLRLRHLGLVGAFAALVLLPVLATASYLYLKAVDQYASTLGFTVRSEDISSAVDILGGLGAGLGGGASSRDSDILYEFIRSQELVSLVDRKLDLRTLYSRERATDPLLSFDTSGTIEDLTDYWQRMVRISYDASSGLMELRVLAFTPEDAKAIAGSIYDESSKMINDLSAIAREDATRYALEDLEQAIERLKVAREALTAFRMKNQIVDLTADIQGQMGLLNTLQAQLAAALIESDLLLEVAPPGDPRLEQAARRIKVIEARIEEERQKFGGPSSGPSGDNYAMTVADFERLTVDREFAERAYIAALSAYDGARAEANRQSRYLAAYIRPTVAEKSEFPQRELIIGLVALFSFLTWAILALVYYSLRDRR